MSNRISRTPKRRRHARPSHPQLRVEVPVVVPFQDADPTGVAWHGNYFRYFDTARVALLERFGYGYRAMADSGLIWPIVDTRVRYLASASFGDEITVTATLDEWQYRIRILYEVRAADGQRLTEGFTVQVPVDASSGELALSATNDLATRVERALQ